MSAPVPVQEKLLKLVSNLSNKIGNQSTGYDVTKSAEYVTLQKKYDVLENENIENKKEILGYEEKVENLNKEITELKELYEVVVGVLEKIELNHYKSSQTQLPPSYANALVPQNNEDVDNVDEYVDDVNTDASTNANINIKFTGNIVYSNVNVNVYLAQKVIKAIGDYAYKPATITEDVRSTYGKMNKAKLFILETDGKMVCRYRNGNKGCTGKTCIACFDKFDEERILIENYKVCTSDRRNVCEDCWNWGFYKEKNPNDNGTHICKPCDNKPFKKKRSGDTLHVSRRICKYGEACEHKATCVFRHPDDINEAVYTLQRSR